MEDSLARYFREVFEEMEPCSFFHGWEIRNATLLRYNQKTGKVSEAYTDTLLRYMRKHYSNRYELIDRGDSMYRKLY